MSLKSYRERVEKLVRARIGEPIFNGSLDHASIIVENMFAHARSHVCILSGKLNARVYGPAEVVEQARLFLSDSTHKLKILLESDEEIEWKEHPFLSKFVGSDNVEICLIPKDAQDTYDFHFLVMDGDSYRFEGDKTKFAAIAAFGEEDGAKNMEKIFNRLWNEGVPLRLPQELQ